MKKFFYSGVFAAFLLFSVWRFFLNLTESLVSPETPNVVNVYTWGDFIPKDIQAQFEKETGYKLNIDYIDSDEMLEAKLLTGKSEYDVVYPSTPYVFRHVSLNLYEPLNLSLIPNIQNIDKDFLDNFSINHKTHAVPYLWGSSGLCYNEDIFDRVFLDENIESWTYVFDPEKLTKISKYGVASNTSPNELFSSLAFWRGDTPKTQDASEKHIEELYEIAREARPFWRVFLSSDGAIQALGSGEVAIAFVWNGDAVAAINMAKTKNKRLKYMVPKEGALQWVDSLAIPKTAKNKTGAYALINFLLQVKNMAAVTNCVRFANTSALSKRYISPNILNNRALYPSQEEYGRLYLDKRINPKLERSINRHFFKILVGY